MPTTAISSSGSATTTVGAAAPVTSPFGPSSSSRRKGERERGRIVVDEGGGRLEPGGVAEPVAQLDGGEGVEAGVLERLVGLDLPGPVWPSTVATWVRDQVQEQGPRRSAEVRPASRPARPLGAAGGDAGGGAPAVGISVQQGRYVAAGRGLGADGPQVEFDRDEEAVAVVQGRVEEVQALVGVIAWNPPRCMRAWSTSFRWAVMPVACSHRPHASDTPGNPAARRRCTTASTYAFAAA